MYNNGGTLCVTSENTIAEAILDRIKHNAYEVMIAGSVSIRERHGLKATEGTQPGPRSPPLTMLLEIIDGDGLNNKASQVSPSLVIV